jgi:hypothetical protein
MTGSHRFPTGSRNHSHDRFPVPPYIGEPVPVGVQSFFSPSVREPVKEPPPLRLSGPTTSSTSTGLSRTR